MFGKKKEKERLFLFEVPNIHNSTQKVNKFGGHQINILSLSCNYLDGR